MRWDRKRRISPGPVFYIRSMLVSVLLCISFRSGAQSDQSLITNTVILKPAEQEELRTFLSRDQKALNLYQTIKEEAIGYLNDVPNPVEVIYYEGLLDTDSSRIRTVKSLVDMNKLIAWYYASFGTIVVSFEPKIKEYVVSWAETYVPTGNTINENKFVPLFWSYFLFRDRFTDEEKMLVERWMKDIASKQLARARTPNNNWQAKRIKIIGLVGGITANQHMLDTALIWTKKYINSSLFEDGTTTDLRTRDALHYHNSGLKALLSLCINLSIFDERFHLYDDVTASGGSIRKSVDYVVPYAMGEKTHEEWVNTKIELDRRRAAAGIAKYQSGVLFDPKDAISLFELACYYDRELYQVIAHLLNTQQTHYAMTWESMLNSPMIRQ